MLLKEKTSPGDRTKHFKAAGGDREVMHQGDSTFAPTIAFRSLCTVLALHSNANSIIDAWYVTAAFLNARLSKVINMDLDRDTSASIAKLKPEWSSFIRSDGKMTVQLMKALYGIKEAGLLWYRAISSSLLEAGLKMSKLDPCLFYKVDGKKHTHVCLHVDDLLVCSNDRTFTDFLRGKLELAYKKLKVQTGKHITYLGMEINR